MAGNNSLLILGGLGAVAYFTRASWLPTAEADYPGIFGALATATGATGNSPTAPTLTTANQPITINTPGAVPIGTQGCFMYPNGTAGSMVMNCPPGISPPATTPAANNCAAGFTLDAGGICTMYPDAVLLASLNTIQYSGSTNIPAEQLQRIDPQILTMYSTTTGVNGGSVLAYMLGLGGVAADGTIMNGSDGNAYKSLGGVFYSQGPSSLSTGGATTAVTSTVNGIGRLGRLGALAQALPITNATLIMASSNPTIAALVGRDQRAMLTAAQWNNYYTQATGIVQGIPLHPQNMQGALMSAAQYQARRAAAGLQTTSNLGTLRPARRGAFPLGAITQWIPPGNRTIYQIPGRGAVPAGRGGGIPPRKLGLITNGGGNHRWARSPFPQPSWWREAE
jgi:hypothetical protein